MMHVLEIFFKITLAKSHLKYSSEKLLDFIKLAILKCVL
jgi:hypothetical protein